METPFQLKTFQLYTVQAIAFYALMFTEFSSLVRFSCWFRSMGLDGIYQPIRNRMRSINRKPLLKNVKQSGPSQHTPQNHMQGLTRDPWTQFDQSDPEPLEF